MIYLVIHLILGALSCLAIYSFIEEEKDLWKKIGVIKNRASSGWYAFAIFLPVVPIFILLYLQVKTDEERDAACREKFISSKLQQTSLSTSPHNAPYVGDFNEPYCREFCFSEAREKISQAYAKRVQGMCALCGNNTYSQVCGVIFLDGNSGHRTLICPKCTTIAKDVLKHYTKCTACKRDIPSMLFWKGRCDVCSVSISDAEGTKEYTADEFSRMVANGFEPDDKMMEVAEAMGTPRSTAVAEWKRNAWTSKTGWLLCPSCVVRAERIVKTMPTLEDLAAAKAAEIKAYDKKETINTIIVIAVILLIIFFPFLFRMLRTIFQFIME